MFLKCSLNDFERSKDPDIEMKRPVMCGYFSLDKDQQYRSDDSELKYLYLPDDLNRINFDLTFGWRRAIKKPEIGKIRKIDTILKWIDDGNNIRHTDGIDFISMRGCLRELMQTLYNTRSDSYGWAILATSFNGTIYLCIMDTEAKINGKPSINPEILSYGFKFEQYLMTADPNLRPETSGPVNEVEEFCASFKVDFGALKLLYIGEVDGVRNREKVDLKSLKSFDDLKLIELKSTLYFNDYNPHKLRDYWCQSIWANIDMLYIGQRNKRGVVYKIEPVHVDELPKMVKQAWKPKYCRQFLHKLLVMIKEDMEGINCPFTVYKYEYLPEKGVINRANNEGKSEYSFLPSWYIDKVNKTKAKKEEI